MKERFIEYLKSKSPEKSGKPSSYARAMEIIEQVLFKENLLKATDVWKFINEENIDDIYKLIIKHQSIEDGIFQNFTPISYWRDGYCSAALKEYKEFISSNITDSIKNNQNYSATSHFTTHPFLILAGISGTGKSRFVREQARRSCGIPYEEAPSNPENFCLVPVRPDWHEPSDLLGYISRINNEKYIATEFLKFIVKAWIHLFEKGMQYENEEFVLNSTENIQPYWLCLDEMNLAPVEQYFADYLSILETRKWSGNAYTCDAILSVNELHKLNESVRTQFFAEMGILFPNIDEESFREYLASKNLSSNSQQIYQVAFSKIIQKIMELEVDDNLDFWSLNPQEAIDLMSDFSRRYRSENPNSQITEWVDEMQRVQGNGDISAVAGHFIQYAQSRLSPLAKIFLEKGIPLPPNLIVAGTVNMDETTHGFSRKVLDRALSLDFNEFYPNNFDQFFEDEKSIFPKTLSFSTITQVEPKDLSNTVDSDGKATRDFVKSINQILQGTPFELAYRALNQALMLVAMWGKKDPSIDEKIHLAAIWDDFLMMKVLPRIEGDEMKIGEDEESVLKRLHKELSTMNIFKEIWDNHRPDLLQEGKGSTETNLIPAPEIPCRSRAKIEWMINRMNRGYTSFWA